MYMQKEIRDLVTVVQMLRNKPGKHDRKDLLDMALYTSTMADTNLKFYFKQVNAEEASYREFMVSDMFNDLSNIFKAKFKETQIEVKAHMNANVPRLVV